MRYWTAILLAVGCVLAGCGSKPSLAPDQQQAWDTFLSEHLAEGTTDAVVAFGDPIVPYIEEQLGKDDERLVVVLGRIGTPRAIQAITKVLAHDYPGAIGPDRLAAAKALVWLGAEDAAPALESAIADHERRIRERGQAGRLEEEVNSLKRALERLREGEGKGAFGAIFTLDETE